MLYVNILCVCVVYRCVYVSMALCSMHVCVLCVYGLFGICIYASVHACLCVDGV